MKSERWARLKDLLDQALALAPEQRSEFVNRECGSDTELRVKLEELLAASQDLDDFIAPPKGHVIPVDQIYSSANEEGLLGKLGNYSLIQEIGRGGRGVVYLAKESDTDRLVALKVLSLSALPSAVSVERFQREARSVERLEHPAIVKVRSLEQELGRPFLVMDYIDGPDLASEITKLQVGAEVDRPSVLRAKNEKPSEVAARLVRVIAEAAQHAHERGIIHRDIKPHNVLLDQDGKPYLVDFGLARDDSEVTLTRTGEVEGTPNYMSPEQVRAERNEVDHRTDVYSLGVVLYELLTLKRPFEAPTANQVMSNITSRAPLRVRKINADVPRDLELVCLKAMEKDPRHRYQSAAELADDLGRFLDHESVQAKALHPGQLLARHIARRPLPWGVGAATGVLIGAVFMVSNWIAKTEAFGNAEQMLLALALTEGEYEPMPDLGSALGALQVAEKIYGEPPEGLAVKVEQALQWRIQAREYLNKSYLDFEQVEVSIGNWRYQSLDERMVTLPQAYQKYSAGLTALGFTSEARLPFFKARQPQLMIELREPEFADQCSVYLAFFIPAENRYSKFENMGLVGDCADGVPLQEDTSYRLFLRSEDGRIAECTVLPMPARSKLVLKVGLRRPDDRNGMVKVESGVFDWLEAQGEGELENRILVNAFSTDELPVTFGEYWDYLEEIDRDQFGQWTPHEGLKLTLRDRPVVVLPPYDMAAFAAWHGKRMISMPEFKLAAIGQDGGLYPAGVVPEVGHPTMPFDKPKTKAEIKGEIPEGAGDWWYWMTEILPSVNSVPDYDQGPSGMKMIWANVGQITESIDYQSYGGGIFTPTLWVASPTLLWSPETAIRRGLGGRDSLPLHGFGQLLGFRCALSDNSIP
jgi:tRNA A-37 threonylcarbamoyl transferase component Bud32